MRTIRSLILLGGLLGAFASNGQTFTYTGPTAVPNFTTIFADITVAGVGVIDCSYGLDQVCIDITHTRDNHLDIHLVDPAGDVYELSTDNGGSGDHYTGTCFDMSAATNITAGTPPFTGTFIPEGNDMNLANNGQNANGTWRLRVRDDSGGASGTLNSWSITFAATPECPPAPTTSDCAGGTTVCSDATFSGNAGGSGNVNDLGSANDGCLNGENESSWYYFQCQTDGDYEFTITTSVDYDFAVWGPYTPTTIVCPPATGPIRCSYAAGDANTGLAIGSGDNSEGAGGDRFVNEINGLAGEVYVLCIDNYAADGSSFTLDWTLSGGANLDCTPLPVGFGGFYGENIRPGENGLFWNTQTEIDNSHFIVQRRTEETIWGTIAQVTGAGNSSQQIAYSYIDNSYADALNYYRLIQVDYDGEETAYPTITIDNRGEGGEVLRVLNPMGQEVSDDYKGLVILYYSDGTARKVIR